MSKSPFEVPTEMRDLAARSVEQARKAFETFIGAAQKASESINSDNPIQKNMADASRMTVGYAERNMNAAFDMAQQLVQAKTIEEAMKIQTDFIQAQNQAIQEQMRDAGAKMKEQIEGVAKEVKSNVAKATEATQEAMSKATGRKK